MRSLGCEAVSYPPDHPIVCHAVCHDSCIIHLGLFGLPSFRYRVDSISMRLSIFFLNGRSRDFGEKCLPTTYLNGYPNIAIFYFEFFASQI
jgi:hypothetical protein